MLTSVLAVVLAADPSPYQLFGHQVRRIAPLGSDELAQRQREFERMLDERGLVRIGDQVRPGAADGGFAQPSEPLADWSSPPHRATIFLNFFGTDELRPGTNSALDESSCLSGSMPWPGFSGNEAQALALIQVFQNKMAPYGVRIAYEERPPSHLPYAMVMMGGTPGMLGLGDSVLGVSCSSDCGDFWWRDTTFAFTDNVNPNNADILGTTALHEAAHAFGLAHIDDDSMIMNPFVGHGDKEWETTCTPYNDATGGINCMPTHDEFCGGGAQNAHAELLAYFGENSPDVEAPVVEILAPADGAEFEPGGSVTVEAMISDDHEGVGWRLVIPEVEQEAVAYAFEDSWALNKLPEGTYTLRVEAIDHDRNEAFDEVTIYVGTQAPSSDTGGSSGASSGSAGAGESTSGAPDGTGADVGGESSGGAAAATGDGEGCECATRRHGVRPGAAWLVLLPLLRRRRRR